MSRWIGVVIASCAVLASAAVRAEPAFTTMDRGDGLSRVGLDVGVSFLEEDAAGNDPKGLRFDLHGQFVHPKGFGIYGALPLSYGVFDSDLVDDELAIANLELGGLFVIPLPQLTVVLRGGFVLPTAGDGADGFGLMPEGDNSAIANLISVRPRGTDVATVFPSTFWLRLGGSALLRKDQFFFRGDFGFDVPLDDEGEVEVGILDVPFEVDPLIRLNLGAGVVAGPSAIMIELVNLINPSNNDLDTAAEEEEFQHNIALAARFIDGPVRPSISLVFPLDEVARDDVDFMFMIGVQGVLPSAADRR